MFYAAGASSTVSNLNLSFSDAAKRQRNYEISKSTSITFLDDSNVSLWNPLATYTCTHILPTGITRLPDILTCAFEPFTRMIGSPRASLATLCKPRGEPSEFPRGQGEEVPIGVGLPQQIEMALARPLRAKRESRCGAIKMRADLVRWGGDESYIYIYMYIHM